MTSDVAHLAFVCAVLIAYLILTVLGHDGTPVLAILAGQGVGAVIERRSQVAAPSDPPKEARSFVVHNHVELDGKTIAEHVRRHLESTPVR